jgi:hypothetical protein
VFDPEFVCSSKARNESSFGGSVAGVEGLESMLEVSEYPLDVVAGDEGEWPKRPGAVTDTRRVSAGSSGIGL